MTDLETTCRLLDSSGRPYDVRVVFTEFTYTHDDSRETYTNQHHIIVLSVFRLDTDAEVDYQGLPLDQRDTILEACIEHAEKQNIKHN